MAVEISEGLAVFTSDGTELGKVKSVEPSAFRVDAPRALDYWLENTLVADSAEGRINLSIAESEVAGYRMDRPHDHNGFRQAPPAAHEKAAVQAETMRRGGRPGI
jgi:hypothetical protein